MRNGHRPQSLRKNKGEGLQSLIVRGRKAAVIKNVRKKGCGHGKITHAGLKQRGDDSAEIRGRINVEKTWVGTLC